MNGYVMREHIGNTRVEHLPARLYRAMPAARTVQFRKRGAVNDSFPWPPQTRPRPPTCLTPVEPDPPAEVGSRADMYDEWLDRLLERDAARSAAGFKWLMDPDLAHYVSMQARRHRRREDGYR